MFPILILLRPKHWIKNLFVLLPVIFSGFLLEFENVRDALLIAISFCFVSSSVYCLNDVVDYNYDRQHPVKKNRPIASDQISKEKGILIAVFMFFLGTSISYTINYIATQVLILYLLNNILYSFYLKNIALLDVMSISFGFILRMLAGTVVTPAPPSVWIFLTTFFISLFLGLCKRLSESIRLANTDFNSSHKRKSLELYTISTLENFVTVIMASVIMCYSLYTVSSDVLDKFGNNNLIYTIPFVIYGMFYYYNGVIQRSLGENPISELLTSKPLLLSVALWILSCCAIIYG